MHLIYQLYFHIYVAMCLFDVVVALDVKKIEKKSLFLYFFEVLRHFLIYSDVFCRCHREVTVRTLADTFPDTI